MLDHSPSPAETIQSSDALSDVFMEPLLDQSASSFEPVEFNFEFSDHNYRYYDVSTPCSSLSPASSSCLPSPCSFTLDSPSPPPTTADFCEFFQASGNMFEKDFSNLTLSGSQYPTELHVTVLIHNFQIKNKGNCTRPLKLYKRLIARTKDVNNRNRIRKGQLRSSFKIITGVTNSTHTLSR